MCALNITPAQTATHEAGHCYMAHIVGAKVEKVRMLKDGPDAGEMVLLEEEADLRGQSFVKHEYFIDNQKILFTNASYIACGGPIAGRMYEGDFLPLTRSEAPRDLVDRVFLADTRNDWCALARPLEQMGIQATDAYRLIAELCCSVYEYLLHGWDAVQKIADELLIKTELTGAQIESILTPQPSPQS